MYIYTYNSRARSLPRLSDLFYLYSKFVRENFPACNYMCAIIFSASLTYILYIYIYFPNKYRRGYMFPRTYIFPPGRAAKRRRACDTFRKVTLSQFLQFLQFPNFPSMPPSTKARARASVFSLSPG